MKYTSLLFLLLLSFNIYAQAPDFNLELVAEVQPGVTSNDIWGYVDTDGTEYALLGTTVDAKIYRLSDPANPVLVAEIPGHTSTWRDIKSFGTYIYITADNTSDQDPDGLTIVDMSQIGSNSVTFEMINTFEGDNGLSATFGTCHNLNIDVANGILVLSGCNDNAGGNLYFDLNDNPALPRLTMKGPAVYAHDNVTQGGYTYSSDLTNDLNIINSSTGEVVGTQMTGRDFTHNAWPSDDGTLIFTTDERANAYVESYDISDFENIQFLDRYRPSATDGSGVIPHNAHFIDGYLVTSYYTDGLKIIDGNQPDILVEVGSYDTWLNSGQGFNGLWGAYPYLPSGLILGSDLQKGLFVWRPSYKRALYLKGDVVDAASGNSIFDADVTISNDLLTSRKLTDVQGEFKTGIAQDPNSTIQMVTVTVNKLGYDTYQETMELTPGECTTINVRLSAGTSLTGQVTNAQSNAVLENSKIFLTKGVDSFEYTTDAAGNFIGPIFPGVYSGYVGKWGYDLQVITDLTIEEGDALSFMLEPGNYFDEFALDLGWTIDNQGSTGFWERVEPIGTFDDGVPSNPDIDADDDNGDLCYVTGNGGGIAANDDIDGGINYLISPSADISGYSLPELQFDYWFYIGGGNSAFNDSLKVLVSDGNTIVEVFNTATITDDWTSSPIIELSKLGLDLSNPVTITVAASDNSPGHIVEAAIDRVNLYDARFVATRNELDQNLVIVKDNPSASNFKIEMNDVLIGSQISVYNVEGKLIESMTKSISNFELGQSYSPGIYFLEMTNKEGSLIKKLIKL